MRLHGCPCGFATDPHNDCSCTPPQIQKYLSRVSGPLLDRIDIHIEVPSVKYKELASDVSGEDSAAIRERVIRARAVQQKRFTDKKHLFCNARMESKEIRQYCKINQEGHELLKTAITKLGFICSGL